MLLCILLPLSIHTIEEGSVGVYYKYGRLLDDITEPGVHTLSPGITKVEIIRVRQETQTLKEIKTITKDGIANSFDGIQVISSVKIGNVVSLVKLFGKEFKKVLTVDRIEEALKETCSNYDIDYVSK